MSSPERKVVPFIGQRRLLSREEAIEAYILLRLRSEDLNRLAFLVEALYEGKIQTPQDCQFSRADLKDTVRTAFFGWLATLTDRDQKAVYAFDPLLVLFPEKRGQIIKVQIECEACHGVLQQFRNNVAFHSRSDITAHIKARRALIDPDETFLDLDSARKDFQHLMSDLISGEVTSIPELGKTLTDMGVQHHPAFANVF